MIRLKRAYDHPEREDGERILVDRLWPRGVKRETLQLDTWLKELAPSVALRTWYGQAPDRWQEFRKRYEAELAQPDKRAVLRDLALRAQKNTITLVYATRDTERNSAVVLKAVLLSVME